MRNARLAGAQSTGASSGLSYEDMASPSIEALCLEIRSVLLARRQRLAEEIGRHPRPITACDVHFNRLLEERARVSEEIDRFDQFVASSILLTPDAKERIRSSAENGVCP